jgi:allantoicase
MKRCLIALSFLAAFAFALPSAAVDLSASPETIAAEKAHWVELLSEKQNALADAKARQARAQATYQRIRTRANKSGGDTRLRAVTELRNSEDAVAEAEAELEATLTTARREGVPPGWIRDAERRSSTAPAAANN